MEQASGKAPATDESTDRLASLLIGTGRWLVLTGAGISSGSGIPEYRDEQGRWKRPPPVQYRDFLDHHATRQRYWARSLAGWPWFRRARPNRCHQALVDWERRGLVERLVTQNVDRLHQSAGSQAVIDLHGRLDRVICVDCGTGADRDSLHDRLGADNPDFAGLAAAIAPDGDAYLGDVDFSAFRVPACPRCGGILKPDVVFFGETVPRERTALAMAAMDRAPGLLVIGSSLMVYSGFRFCRTAVSQRKPVVAITPGRTRADDLLSLKIPERFETVLDRLNAGTALAR